METVGGDLPKAWANAEAIAKDSNAQITPGILQLYNKFAGLASAALSGILSCNVRGEYTEDRIPRSMMGHWTLNLKSALRSATLDPE